MDPDVQRAVKSPEAQVERWTRWIRWTPWLVLAGLVLVFVACPVGMWFWYARPVQFTEHDLYGTWVSDRPDSTTLEFRQDGTVRISGVPFPQEHSDCPTVGEYEWHLFPGYDPDVSIMSDSCGQSIYAENGLFSTNLALYIGDPDQTESRIKFTHQDGTPPK